MELAAITATVDEDPPARAANRRAVVVPVAAAALALAVGAFAERAALDGDVWGPGLVALDAAVGVATVLAGLTAWLSRPRARAGPALVAVGGLWFLGAFGYGRDMALVDLVGFPLQGWQDPLVIVLMLAVTPGGLREPAARWIAAGAVAAHAALGLARLLLRPPIDITSCLCVPNRITGVTAPDAYEAVIRVAGAAEAVCAGAALALLLVRWRRAARPARRVLAPLVAGGAIAAAVVTYDRLVTRVLSDPYPSSDALLALMAVARVAVPLAIMISLLRGRRARSRVAEVLLSLEERGVSGGSAAMRDAFGDPRLQLLRWSSHSGEYLDGGGQAVALPGPDEPLTARPLERDGVRLGVLIHDATLREEPELLEAVAAAGRLALHNERLALEVSAQLADAQASRRRIVESADAERRRLERDLHDGAQQRLVVLLLSLRTLQRRTGEAGDIALADALDGVAAQLVDALAEIQALGRGIRPPVLQEEGLGPALRTLAERAPLPVEVDVRLSRRHPAVLESAGYFAAAEALANVLKYAGATRVRLSAVEADGGLVVTTRDDGRGGADLTAGTGLVGLDDRLQALGGSLTVDSPPGQGTTIVARLPAQSAG